MQKVIINPSYGGTNFGKISGNFIEKDGWHVEEQELQKLCEEQLAKFKVPKKWLKTTNLPKTASNKIMRRRLREMIENNEWG